MEKTRAFALILIIVLASLLGFIVENVSTGISYGKIDNRNMILPFLLGYGLAIITIYKLFGTPNSPMFFGKELTFSNVFFSVLYYFGIAFLCVSIGELILGHFIEYSCQIVWWDYTRFPLHITKYTSIPTSLIFAALITVFMKCLFSPLINIFSKINPKILPILALWLIILLSIDFIHSAIYMFKNHKTLQLWNIYFK